MLKKQLAIILFVSIYGGSIRAAAEGGGGPCSPAGFPLLTMDPRGQILCEYVANSLVLEQDVDAKVRTLAARGKIVTHEKMRTVLVGMKLLKEREQVIGIAQAMVAKAQSGK